VNNAAAALSSATLFTLAFLFSKYYAIPFYSLKMEAYVIPEEF